MTWPSAAVLGVVGCLCEKVLMNTFCDPFPTPAPEGIYMDPIQQSFCVTHRRDFSATSLATFRAAEMASNAEY